MLRWAGRAPLGEMVLAALPIAEHAEVMPCGRVVRVAGDGEPRHRERLGERLARSPLVRGARGPTKGRGRVAIPPVLYAAARSLRAEPEGAQAVKRPLALWSRAHAASLRTKPPRSSVSSRSGAFESSNAPTTPSHVAGFVTVAPLPMRRGDAADRTSGSRAALERLRRSRRVRGVSRAPPAVRRTGAGSPPPSPSAASSAHSTARGK